MTGAGRPGTPNAIHLNGSPLTDPNVISFNAILQVIRVNSGQFVPRLSFIQQNVEHLNHQLSESMFYCIFKSYDFHDIQNYTWQKKKKSKSICKSLKFSNFYYHHWVPSFSLFGQNTTIFFLHTWTNMQIWGV